MTVTSTTVGTCCRCRAENVPVTAVGTIEQTSGPGYTLRACTSCAPTIRRHTVQNCK
ncbi:hypothetical protein ACWC5I_23070 [Kitasatospora sp. NPDC001574]